MRTLVCVVAAVGLLGTMPAVAQDAVISEPAEPIIESPDNWSVDQTTVVAVGALAGFVLASTPVTVPALIGAAAGSGVAYWWYGTTGAD